MATLLSASRRCPATLRGPGSRILLPARFSSAARLSPWVSGHARRMQPASYAADIGEGTTSTIQQGTTNQYPPGFTSALHVRCRALVLDSSYRPIDVVNWQRAICLDLFDKVEVLEYYDTYVRSASDQFMVPAVLRVRCFVQKNFAHGAKVSLSRRNIMIRDKFICQYCGAKSDLTIDHVKPASKGGSWDWHNLVTACMKCNSKKGDKSLRQMGWKLKVPKEPSVYETRVMVGMRPVDVHTPPKEWTSYLFPGQLVMEHSVSAL